jgi:hypothetical protein
MGPPVRFVRRRRKEGKCDDGVASVVKSPQEEETPDDAELLLRINELKKFIVRWEHHGGGCGEEGCTHDWMMD